MKKILLLAHIPTHFVELFRVAKLVENSNSYDPQIIFFGKYENYERDIKLCDSTGINWSFFFKKDYQNNPIWMDYKNRYKNSVIRYPERQTVFLKLIGLIKQFRSVIRLIEYFTRILIRRFYRKYIAEIQLFIYLKYYFLAKNLLLQEKISLIVLAENNVGYRSGIWVKLSRKLGIPSIIIPYTIANKKESAEAFLNTDNLDNKKIIFRFIKSIFPKWVYRHKNHDLLRLPLNEILIQEILGIAPKDPWFINSGDVDAIAVENQALFDYYRKEKIPEEKLILTGSLTDDQMFYTLRNKLEKKAWFCSELGLNPDYPILLCALPPDPAPRSSEFLTHKALIEFLVSILGSVKNWGVVLKIHPRENLTNYDFLKDFDLKVSQSDTVDLIPLCDMYVASVSATIRWAIECGVPVINFDVFQFHYDDFDGAPSVRTLYDCKSFEKEIMLLTKDLKYFQALKGIQVDNRERWSMLDGQVGERMLNLFDDLTSKYERK